VASQPAAFSQRVVLALRRHGGGFGWLGRRRLISASRSAIHPVKSCALIGRKCAAVTPLDEVGERSF
jgi:hypothetical protein